MHLMVMASREAPRNSTTPHAKWQDASRNYTTLIKQKIYLFANAACSTTRFHATVAPSVVNLNTLVRLEPGYSLSLKPCGE